MRESVEREIRNATRDDAPALVTLYREAYRENAAMGFPSSMTTVEESTVEAWFDDRTVFVATRPGEVLGAVQVIPRSDWDVPEIGRLAVLPEAQGQWLGGRLLERAEEQVRSDGWTRVRLRTLSGHPFLEDWYRRAGYERVGIERLANRPYDAPILEKEL